ncbi:MAG: OpgC domain-containing protein [Cereibacter changlensis]
MSDPARPFPPSGRDQRLDVFRGIALVMIFINHVPSTIYENLTSRNFGFSDAAEGFVVMSGIAAGLAYSAGFRPAPTWAGARRIWRRAWTLYMVHMLTSIWAIAVSAAAALWFAAPQLLHENQVWILFKKPLGFLVGLPLMTHQLGYTNILPLYTVLLIAAPALLILALRWPRLLLAGSVLLWAAAGQFRLNLPNFPNPGGWFFNPVSWQLLFVVGLMTGVAMKQGRRFVPVLPWLQWLTGGYLLFSLLSAKIPAVSAMLGHGLWMVNQAGVPWFFTVFDKTFVTAPRLLHILSLVYFLSTLAWVRQAATAQALRTFALLGRHSLPVFATGTVLCFALQGVKDVLGDHFLLDTLLLGGGLGLQLGLAFLTERWTRKPARPATPPAPSAPVLDLPLAGAAQRLA